MLVLINVTPGQLAFDTLSGELHGTLRYSGKPYLVTTDISVPVGESVTLEPGVILLFSEFTGLQVHGTLLARGTESQQVYFSSFKDKALSGMTDSADAAPYDWNGIVIDENALGSVFDNCVVCYSLYGIKSSTAYMSIKSCVFFRNGKGNVSINGVEMKTGEAPFSYATSAPKKAETPAPALPLTPEKRRSGKPALTVAGAVVFAGGLAVGIWKTVEYRHSIERFNALNQPADPNVTKSLTIEQDWNDAKKRRDQDLLMMAVGYAAALVGVVGITISF